MTGMGPAHHALKYHRLPRQVDLIWPRVLKPRIYHCIIILGPPHPVKEKQKKKKQKKFAFNVISSLSYVIVNMLVIKSLYGY
jgi:hypothetical protein